ncbi:MAG: amidohydrolase [Chloroflexi bacterium]|nr:amidohydrolase [Chloroflexota bacterium]
MPEVIDFHIHILQKEQYNPPSLDFVRRLNPETFEERMAIIAHPASLKAHLQKEGVHYGVILAENAPVTTGMVPNEFVAQFCRGEEMLIPFASINPNNEADPAARLVYCVEELGMRGLKLLPPYGLYYPNDVSIYPVYAEAQRLRIPVLIHTGSSTFRGSRMKYGDPLYLDDVAVDFPRLTIVMAHSGRGPFYERAFFLARHHSNIYMEISGLPPQRLLDYFPEFERNADKTIFGSDWPAIPQGIGDNIRDFCALPLKSSTMEKVLYRNAERILFGG